jgi:hypothetical protein
MCIDVCLVLTTRGMQVLRDVFANEASRVLGGVRGMVKAIVDHFSPVECECPYCLEE